MWINAKSSVRKLVVAMLVLGVTVPVLMISTVRAHDGEEHEGQRYSDSNPKWKEDCGACHLAYPPRMLPAESWRAIMAGLDKHFGSDASLDAETADEITAFLVQNADTRKHKKTDKPLLRITETGRFKSEHEEVAARIWKNPKVKSPANCGACHTTAESGDYSEDNVRIPK